MKTSVRYTGVSLQRTGWAALVVAALLLGVPACGDDGATWVDVRTLPWNRAFVTGGPPPVRIGFTEDAITARAECNTMNGAARIEDGVLVVEQMSTTEMGCDAERQAYDEFLAAFLTSRPTITIDDEQNLTLTSGSDTLVLTDREVADPDRPLVATDWVVDGIVSGDAVSSVPAGVDAHLRFTEWRVDGSTSCNSFGGDMKIVDGELVVSEWVSTLQACPDDVTAVEQAIAAPFLGNVIYEINGTTLRLTGPDGHGLVLQAAE